MNYKDVQMIRIGPFGDEKKFDMGYIDNRKKLNDLLKKSRHDSKVETCLYCNKKCSSFCNSHSIPAFSLKNISTNGMVYNCYKLVSYNFEDEEIGVKKTGTFQLICRECDSKIFSDYENPKNYIVLPTAKMIAQIAMKNYLKMIYKKLSEIAMYNNVLKQNDSAFLMIDYEQNINRLDLFEYKAGFSRAKKTIEKNIEDNYYLFYYKKLDYVVPIAFQSLVALISDFQGNLINNIYNLDPKYKIKYLHITIMPLETETVVMMFVETDNKRYRRFYKQFNKLSQADKLSAINYIIFSYSEEIFMSKEINNQILTDKKLKRIAEMTARIESSEEIVNPIEQISDKFDLKKMNDIPNLLIEDYKIR